MWNCFSCCMLVDWLGSAKMILCDRKNKIYDAETDYEWKYPKNKKLFILHTTIGLIDKLNKKFNKK